MEDALSIVTGQENRSGLYQLPKSVSVEELRTTAQYRGFQFYYVDGNDVADKASFLQQSAAVLGFPDYYGANWDAFEECLADPDAMPAAPGYVVVYDHVTQFAQAAPQDWRIALDIFRSATEYWQTTNTPMYIFVRNGADVTAVT